MRNVNVLQAESFVTLVRLMSQFFLDNWSLTVDRVLPMACSLVHLIDHMVNKSDNNLPIGIKNVLHCMGDQINLFSAYIFSLLQRFKNKPGSIEMSMKTFRSYKVVNLMIRYIKNFVRDFRFTNPFYTILIVIVWSFCHRHSRTILIPQV